MEEIVVQARMQEETLQEVPVAVTSIGEAALEAFRIDEATDLVGRVPALNIIVGGSGAGHHRDEERPGVGAGLPEQRVRERRVALRPRPRRVRRGWQAHTSPPVEGRRLEAPEEPPRRLR